MNAGTKLAAINKFRNAASQIMRTAPAKVLVVYDVQVKTPEVSQIPLVVNYGQFRRSCFCSLKAYASTDLPKAVEEYAHRYVFPVLT